MITVWLILIVLTRQLDIPEVPLERKKEELKSQRLQVQIQHCPRVLLLARFPSQLQTVQHQAERRRRRVQW